LKLLFFPDCEEEAMKIAMAQINPVVGDFNYNAGKIKEYVQKCGAKGFDLIIFPELALTGYPPKDLLLRNDFRDAVQKSLKQFILPLSKGKSIITGMPICTGRGTYNSAVFLQDGKILETFHKTLLPDYDVFDESRYFIPSDQRKCVEFMGRKLAVTVCEDIWNDKDYWDRRRYADDPVAELAGQGAEMIVNISASPYHFGKYSSRVDMLSHTARKYNIPVIYVNQVGGNDDLIFDGSSCIINGKGELCLQMAHFKEDFFIFDSSFPLPGGNCKGRSPEKDFNNIRWLYDALVLGIRDYFFKTGFKRALVGLSGGIDSSLTAALATAALGPENVLGVAMPSRYSSPGSLSDAEQLAVNLGIEYRVISIENMFSAYLAELNPGVNSMQDLAEENIQARIRGSILMFISNREGYLVLVTGNKSEVAMGYSTLYGDMCGGLGVLADVPKVMVYRLANYINEQDEIIPKSVIRKPPSAELRPHQVDRDSLPPYEDLDAILEAYIEQNKSLKEITAMGYKPEIVEEIMSKADRAEYKRQQAAPGIRVTSRAFGPGRRVPIAHRWSGCF